jgi:hypothetical protein
MSQSPESGSRLSRRDFARQAAMAAASAAALPGQVFGAERADAAAPQDAQPKRHAPNDSAEIESKTEAIFQKYSSRLSDAQKGDIRRLVRQGQKPLDAMRAFPTGNADQPGNVLKLYPEPAGEDAPSSRR